MARRALERQIEPSDIRRHHAGRVRSACRGVRGTGQTSERNRAGNYGGANLLSPVTHLHKPASDLRRGPRIRLYNGLLPSRFRTDNAEAPAMEPSQAASLSKI